MMNCLKYNNCNLGHMYDELLLTNDISLIKYPSKPRVNMHYWIAWYSYPF
jgi:hypothetical protein